MSSKYYNAGTRITAHDKYNYEHVGNPIKKVEVLDFVPLEDTPRRKRKLENNPMPLTAQQKHI